MSFLDPTFVKIILELNKKGGLTKEEIATIVDQKFPYVSKRERDKALYGANSYAKILEKCGYAIRLNYKGGYTLQITKKGEEVAKGLKESEKNESS